MSSRSFRYLLTCAAVIQMTAGLLCAQEPTGGFGIGPGMMMLENIRPGAPKPDVNSSSATFFAVHNGSDKKQIFSIYVLKPSTVIETWEMGYTEIPDISWCSIDKSEIEVAPQSDGKVSFFVQVPDKPEYYNRKWMVVLACSPGKQQQTGTVGLQVASRIQLETLADPLVNGTAAGKPVGLAPSICEMPESQPAAFWHALVRVYNNTEVEHTYEFKRLDEVEPEARRTRYFGQGYESVINPSWLSASQPFAIKPGAFHQIDLKVSIPENVIRGKKYEELLIIKDEKGHSEFVRVRTEIAKTPAQ